MKEQEINQCSNLLRSEKADKRAMISKVEINKLTAKYINNRQINKSKTYNQTQYSTLYLQLLDNLHPSCRMALGMDLWHLDQQQQSLLDPGS